MPVTSVEAHVSATNRRRATVVGFAGALLVLAGLLWLVGVDEVTGALRRANPPVLALVCLAAVGWLLAWALSLRQVLAILDVRIGVVESILLFSATVFANNVTPFGQAGGEPISALLISRTADSEYETGLAAIVSLDALIALPSLPLALVGLGYYATRLTLPDRLEVVGVVLAAISVGLPLAGLTLWRRRRRAQSALARAIGTAVGAVGRLVPRWRPPDAAAVDARLAGFVGALEQVADDRRGVTVALSLATLGWVGLIVCLWLSLVALGFTDPLLLAAAFVAVPVGSVAAATPFPGGLGGMEAAFVGVLAAITALPAATLGAAVVCYRVATYWLPTIVGGAAASAFGSRW